MRQKKGKGAILLLLLCVCSVAVIGRKVEAASAVIRITALSERIQVGDTFSVSVQLTSSVAIGEVSQVIQYDTSILQFVTETSIYEESDGAITIKDENPSKSNQRYILQFKAIKEGTAQVGILGTPAIYSEELNVLSFSNNDLSVTVGAKKAKSKNCSLKSLAVKEGQMENAFQKAKTEYTMRVGQGTTSLDITAVPEDSSAEVSISGADKLLVGENIVTIKVTSEADTTKEYTIKVTRGEETFTSEEPLQTEEPVPSSVPEKETAMVQEDRVQVKDGVLYVADGKCYEFLTLDNLRLLPKGYLSQSLSIDGQAVDAYQIEGQEEQGMYLIYARQTGMEAAFYLYDSKEETVQRYVQQVEKSDMDLAVISTDEYNKKVKQLSMLVGMGTTAIVLLLAISFHYYKRSKDI